MALLPEWESLSLAEQVAQMVVVRASGYLFDHQIQYPDWEPPAAVLQHWVQDLGVGGVILLGGSAGELALRSQQLQDWAKTPLLIAADIEEGVGQRFSGATWFPPPMAIGAVFRKDASLALKYAEQMGGIIASEALAIGINWVLAPVVDVNNNPNNPVINVRAFGENPEEVTQLASAFIRGAKAYPVLTTAKHFPGHGDTAVDSHLDLPVLPHSPARLAEIELLPFQEAIGTGTASGVDAVMSAHLLIPAWDAERPATLSQPILTQLLRQQLGFEGLIVTDALVMGAIANRYGANEAPVLAVEAGADILLMPVDPAGAIQAVCDAVAQGRISEARIRASVERIWTAKRRVQQGTAQPPVEARAIAPEVQPAPSPFPPHLLQLAQPHALATSANIVREALVVHGEIPLLPCQGNLRNLIVVDDTLNCDFLDKQAPAVALPKQHGYQLQLLDPHTTLIPGWVFYHKSGLNAQPTLLQLFIRGNPFRGSAGLTPLAQDLFKKLLGNAELQALVIYGSPYLLEQFLPHLPPHIPCVFSYGQMPAAQAIALEVLFGAPALSI
ncbi:MULTISPECIES: glycoside hydrolase family 3 N-terminal domain-containing protein [unclassified Coleofasciculus]|uniref:glycoside hydrolase family 3 N-terminal domain-containing protein n=1 Tax=Cyanophyceae TaxID=3028117 RepID=UPI00168351D4|nr:beta-glucosidase [Coleofasciculus sp. FACHB-129]MBD2085288.1 beta-glucosidase [Coleofasciculus sp. FACHB-542]